MLSSVTDLLRYIDENQLTSEFGGTLDYCHSDWIVLRTVSFQRTAVALPQLNAALFFFSQIYFEMLFLLLYRP